MKHIELKASLGVLPIWEAWPLAEPEWPDSSDFGQGIGRGPRLWAEEGRSDLGPIISQCVLE